MRDTWSPLNPGAWASRGRKSGQVLAAAALARRHRAEFPVTLLDVGARHGPVGTWRWAHRLGLVDLVLVEPEPIEAQRLGEAWPRATVIGTALDRVTGERDLHVTAEPGRSSFLRPLVAEGAYAVERTIRVPTAPLHELTDVEIAFVKVDVQGAEIDVLEGFGPALDHVVGIEVEVAFERTYEDQPDIGTVNTWLGDHGYVLVDLRTFGLADRVPEADAYYARATALQDPRVAFWRRLRGIPSTGRMLHRI